MEPWQPEVAVPARDPVAWEPYRMIDALRALGVLKKDEEARVLHQHGCAFPSDYSARCACRGGPEIVWADYDEARPYRFYTIPERFITL